MLLKGMATVAKERYPSIQALREAFEACSEKTPVEKKPSQKAPSEKNVDEHRHNRRFGRKWVLPATLACVVLVIGVWVGLGVVATVREGNCKYTLYFDGTATLIGYVGHDKNLTVPEAINGYMLTSIGGRAFYGCDSLTQVTIPDSVTRIGVNAFYGCTSLTLLIDSANTYAVQFAKDNKIPYKTE